MSDVTEPLATPVRSLAEAAALTARTSDLDAALAGLLQLAVDAAGATDAVVFLQDPDRPEAQARGVRGLLPPTPPNAASEIGGTGHPVRTVAVVGATDPAAGLLALVVETAGLVILGVLRLGGTAPRRTRGRRRSARSPISLPWPWSGLGWRPRPNVPTGSSGWPARRIR